VRLSGFGEGGKLAEIGGRGEGGLRFPDAARRGTLRR
jgi:hypothetical protein